MGWPLAIVLIALIIGLTAVITTYIGTRAGK